MRVLVGMAPSTERDDVVASLGQVAVDVSVAADDAAVRLAHRSAHFDAAIVAYDLGGVGRGMDAACWLRDAAEAVVILVDVPTLEARLDGFAKGLDECLAPGTDVREVLARLDVGMRRLAGHRPRVVRVGDLVVDEAGRVVRRDEEVIDLTRTEFELLGALARGRGRVVPVRALVDQVWPDGAADSSLVQAHMSALRRKLELSGPRVIHTVRGVGYVMRSDPEGELLKLP